MSEREKWTEGTRASEVLGRVIVEALQGHYGYLDRIAKTTEIDYASGAPVAVTKPDAQAIDLYVVLDAVDRRFDSYVKSGHAVDSGLHGWIKEVLTAATGEV